MAAALLGLAGRASLAMQSLHIACAAVNHDIRQWSQFQHCVNIIIIMQRRR